MSRIQALDYIGEGATLEERKRRLHKFLENEGIAVPSDAPPHADISMKGQVLTPLSESWHVKYTVTDKSGRVVYHFEEIEVDHIIPRRIEKGDDLAIPYLDKLPSIIRSGTVRPNPNAPCPSRIYRSANQIHFPEVDRAGYLEVVVWERSVDFVRTFYVRW